MERLTKRTEVGIAYLVKVKQNEQEIEGVKNTLQCLFDSWQRLASYEDTGLTPAKVAEFAKAKAEGRLVVLPCKVGDTVYKADFGDGLSEPRISERIIRGFKHTAYTNYPFCDIEFFGKNIFLTREEAEAALRGEFISE